jgi:hypothetical protein
MDSISTYTYPLSLSDSSAAVPQSFFGVRRGYRYSLLGTAKLFFIADVNVNVQRRQNVQSAIGLSLYKACETFTSVL